MDISSSISHAEPVDTASLPYPMENPLNNHLNDAHQRFHKKMDQLADMNVCSICKESYPGIATKKFHGVSSTKRPSIFIGKQYGLGKPASYTCSSYTG